MEKLVFASNNKGKIAELKKILNGKFKVYSMGELGFDCEIEETGSTFYENALIKAKTVSQKLNLNAISDDSGLMVDALNGAPGVFSARYSGEDATDEKNINLLLDNLSNISDRKAKFHTTILLYKTDGTIISADGETFGEILTQRQGENGFGYDPVFYSYDLKKCFGEASFEEKNSISHRKRALDNLLLKLS